ncbi:MAG: response regulator transcription factor, partial [Epulopiscium sp.]|nr:response regulator transcription factor [Candidatus Epulonipiscium sp.]
MNQKILVVDDEKNIADIIKFNLKKEGYEVLTAYDGEEALDIIFSKDPDLILLDIMMPKIDGFQVCRKVREKKSTPIVMLTARAEEVDKVLGLELGADDYVTKPFSVRELMARVKANLRRVSSAEKKSKEENSKSIVTYDNLAINLDKYEVTKNGEVIELTLREFELLKF